MVAAQAQAEPWLVRLTRPLLLGHPHHQILPSGLAGFEHGPAASPGQLLKGAWGGYLLLDGSGQSHRLSAIHSTDFPFPGRGFSVPRHTALAQLLPPFYYTTHTQRETTAQVRKYLSTWLSIGLLHDTTLIFNLVRVANLTHRNNYHTFLKGLSGMLTLVQSCKGSIS